jgi:integrase/recombinase XerD
MEILKKAEFEEFLQNQRGLAATTVREYGYDLKYYYAWLDREKKKVEEIGPKDLTGYVRYLRGEKGLEPKTCKRKIAGISTYYKWMVREGITKNDPVYFIELPKPPKRLPVYLTEDEEERFVTWLEKEAARRPIIGARDKTIFMLMLYAGLRVSEVVGLMEKQVTTKEGYPVSITVIGKGNKERQVYLNEEVSRALKFWIEARKLMREDPDFARKVTKRTSKEIESAYLFAGRSGGHLERSTIGLKMKRIRKELFGEKKVSAHKLRHTFATMLFRAGVDLNTIKELLGHSSIATTQIYAHVEDRQKMEAVKKIGKRKGV